MRGIGRTALLLLAWPGLQRWLVSIGLILTVTGIVAITAGWQPAARPLFGFMSMFGMAIAAMSPVLAGAILFRSLSAPRAVELIPHGRLQLLLGAFSAQLLLALCIGVAVGMAMSRGMVVAFPVAFGALTLHFIGFYWASQFRFGFLWLTSYIAWPPLLSSAIPPQRLHHLFATAVGPGAVLTMSLLAWLIFAVAYLRARRINLPHYNYVVTGTSPRRPGVAAKGFYATFGPRPYSRRDAIRMLLMGSAKNRRTPFSRAMIWGLIFLLLVTFSMSLHLVGANPLSVAYYACVFSGLAPGSVTGLMTRRAKSLWLPAGLGRPELFKEIESQGCRTLFIVTGGSIALAVPQLTFGIHAPSSAIQFLSILAIPLVSGAGFLYGMLLFVRGRRLADILTLATIGALWLMAAVVALHGSAATLLSAVLTTQVVLVPLLRHVARERWQDIDWLVHRPTCQAARLM